MPISSNAYLSLDEMKINAQYIMDKLLPLGWTKNAICATLANMQTESTINPGLWESFQANNMQVGFGLVQWTPASNYTNWADANGFLNDWGNIDGQINKILSEVPSGEQWIKTSTYPMTFEEFTKSTLPSGELALAFLANYERPLEPNQPIRATQGEYWYSTLTGVTPVQNVKKKMPIFMYRFI